MKLHERPRWVGAAHFWKEWKNDRSDQRRQGPPERGAEPGAERDGAGGDLPLLSCPASGNGTDGRAGGGRGQHNPCVRFDSHGVLHAVFGPPTETFQIKYLLRILIASPEWVAPAHKSPWCNGQHSSLPRRRRGFESRWWLHTGGVYAVRYLGFPTGEPVEAMRLVPKITNR